jgi:hypothetical protein
MSARLLCMASPNLPGLFSTTMLTQLELMPSLSRPVIQMAVVLS